MKWYSVKKYKPPCGMDVLVSTVDGVLLLAFHSVIDKWRNSDDTSIELNVTHFCIPDPIPLDDE